MSKHQETHQEIARIYKTYAGQVLSTLVRVMNDFDRAEEALQEAFQVALHKWPEQGIPRNPYAWLVSVGKFKAIDSIRRVKRGRELMLEQAHFQAKASLEPEIKSHKALEDDQLRLIFFCCHPALPLDSRIALSLRDVCGMKTEAIARAYLLPVETLKKRISRAKALFRKLKLPYQVPSESEIGERLKSVLHVIYLIFNEGYSVSSEALRVRKELTDEAIFLARQLVRLIPQPESLGLLALLLFQEARRTSRTNADGSLIPLENQDRTLWDSVLIQEGIELIHQAALSANPGPYTLQAAIASVHAQADSVENTRWDMIVYYYDVYLTILPSSVVRLNRAIAVGMHKDPQAALKIVEQLQFEHKLAEYPLLYAVKADFSAKLGRKQVAVQAYQKAIDYTQQEPERQYLEKKCAELLSP